MGTANVLSIQISHGQHSIIAIFEMNKGVVFNLLNALHLSVIFEMFLKIFQQTFL